MIMARVRGSLYIAVLIVSTIFAAATGIVGASVTLLGIMAGATMTRAGYNVQLVVGHNEGIGYSNSSVNYAYCNGSSSEVSTLDLFRGAFIPGALLPLYLLYGSLA